MASNPTCDFSGQVALVTGASSGVGLATTRAFVQAGAAVVMADINPTTLRAATDTLTAAGHQVLGVKCDVSDEASVADAVGSAVDTFGRIDMAFNNAGIQVPPSDAADEAAEVGLPGRAAYHASKHGVLGLTSSAALEYAPRGIRINAVCPGTIAAPMVTDMIDSGELDIAEAIANQPSTASANPTKSPLPCCGCTAPAPASSLVSPCPSTAVTPPARPRPRKLL